MSKKAEELSVAYTDARLELLRPDIAADNCARGRKMSLDVFEGYEVESAYEAGYEQAEKDVIERACRWLLDNYDNYFDEDGRTTSTLNEFMVGDFKRAM